MMFFLSASIIFVSEHQKGITKTNRKILLLFAILLPTLLAAFRDLSIGTDLRVYGINVFKQCIEAQHFSDLEYLYDWYGLETGYRLLNYVISRLTSQLWILLFVIYSIILGLVVSSFVFIKENINPKFSVAFAMLCFYLLFYNESLNLIRQSMALAISLYSYRFVLQNKKIKFIICVVIAMQFHMTAILVASLFVLYHFIVKNQNIQFVKVGFIICVVGVFLVPRFLRLFMSINYFYGKYASRYNFTGSMSIALTQLIIRVPFIFLLLYQANKKTEKQHDYLFYSLILMLDLVFAGMRSAVATLYRISLYFSWFKPVIYYEIASYYGKQNAKYIKLVIIVFLTLLWFYQIVYQGNGETFPYKFMWN